MKFMKLVAAFIGGCVLCGAVFAGDTPVQKKGVPDAPTVTKTPTQKAPPVTPLQKTPTITKVPPTVKIPQQTTPMATKTPQQITTTKFPSPQQVTQAQEPCGLFARLRARRAARLQTLQRGPGVEVRAPFTRVNIRR